MTTRKLSCTPEVRRLTRMKQLWLGVIGSICCSTIAAAQDAAPEPSTPPPAVVEEPASKIRIDVGLIAGVPQGDFAGEVDVAGNTVDIEAATSPGIHLQLGYRMTDTLGLLVGLRYISVQSDELSDDGIDLASYDIELGGRYARALSPSMTAFGEAMVIRSTVDFSAGGNSMSYSDVGFGARAGVSHRMSRLLDIGGSLGYSTAEIEGYTAAWLGIEGFVSFRL